MSGLKKIVTLLRDRSGATAIEYGLIAGLIALAVIGGATAVGGEANNTFGDVRDGFSASATP
jgi:pilus assembly protein Flp/PilA